MCHWDGVYSEYHPSHPPSRCCSFCHLFSPRVPLTPCTHAIFAGKQRRGRHALWSHWVHRVALLCGSVVDLALSRPAVVLIPLAHVPVIFSSSLLNSLHTHAFLHSSRRPTRHSSRNDSVRSSVFICFFWLFLCFFFCLFFLSSLLLCLLLTILSLLSSLRPSPLFSLLLLLLSTPSLPSSSVSSSVYVSSSVSFRLLPPSLLLPLRRVNRYWRVATAS